MASRKRGQTDFDSSGLVLDDDLRSWTEANFPRIDPDKTLELFADKARALGWVYRDWRAAFRNYLRNSLKFGGVAYRVGLVDPAFDGLLKHAKEIGFRPPLAIESVGTYRQALRDFDKSVAKQAAGLRFGGVLKRIPK